MIDSNWIYLGAALNFIGAGTYVFSVIKGKTRPNRVTWFILAIAPLVAFASMILQGVEFRQGLMTLVVGLSPLIVFLSTFFAKQPVWKIETFDLVCGGLSLFGLLLWLLSREGDVAILFSIIADGLAFLPTLIKAFRYPETESPYLFLLGMFNGLIALLIITKWDFTHVAFPLYIFTADLLAVLFIYFKLGIFLKKHFKPNS